MHTTPIAATLSETATGNYALHPRGGIYLDEAEQICDTLRHAGIYATYTRPGRFCDGYVYHVEIVDERPEGTSGSLIALLARHVRIVGAYSVSRSVARHAEAMAWDARALTLAGGAS